MTHFYVQLSTVLACVVITLLADVTSAGLLRVPKVYNALVTTNEKLVPSRAIQVSAPVLHPVGLTPAVPAVVVTSPYIAVEDPEAKPNKTDTEATAANESDKKPEGEKNGTSNSIPVITPFSLPLAYYNSITYYHNLWPYSYSSVSPATFLFTAPFTYPGIFDLYGSVPWSEAKKPESVPASSQNSASDLPSGAKDEPEKESVSIESS
jgi:hypothetical protein